MTERTQERLTARRQLALGFLGVGWIGTNRMEVLARSGLGQATAICEPVRENTDRALKIAPQARILSDPEELYGNESLDGIVIATPSALHAEQSARALAAGKAVFCQKPLGRTAREVGRVIEASKRADRLLGVDLSYRYTAAFRKVYELITSGALGKVYAVNLVFHNAYGPDKEWFYDIDRSGGGCLMDLGIHLLDLAMWALGFPEVEVESRNFYRGGQPLNTPPTVAEDFAQTTLRAGDTVINLQCSWHLPAGKEAQIGARFYGDRAAAAFRNIDGSFYSFVAEKYTGTQTERLVTPPDDWSGRAGVDWARRVIDGAGFDSVSAAEFLHVTRIMDRMYGR